MEKAAKRRIKCAERVAFFLDTFSWPRKKKYLVRQGEKDKKSKSCKLFKWD